MTRIGITVDNEDALRVLNALSVALADRGKLFKEAGRNLAQRARQGFRSESDPMGQPWRPHSPVTRRERARKGSTGVAKLFDSGRMFSSIRSDADESSATVSIGGEGMFAAVHQRGNLNNKAWGRGLAPIHARPMLPEGPELPEAWALAALGPFDRAIEKALAA